MKVDRKNEQFRLVEKALQPNVLSAAEKIAQVVYKAADNSGKKALLKSAYEKALRKIGAKLDSNFRCFMENHPDRTASMKWSGKSFHCFACMEPGFQYDLFDAISEVYHLGEKSYSQAYRKAMQLFVSGAIDTLGNDFTNEMKVAMRFKCHTDIQDDELGLAYLARRSISKEIAVQNGLCTWEHQGARYIVFINSNGSLVRRLIAVNQSIAGMYVDEIRKWWNQKDKSGFFNYHMIERAQQNNSLVFVVEGAIDCLTLECVQSTFGGLYTTTALNSTQNLPKFLRETDYPYLIGMMDNDSTGLQATEQLKEKKYFVVNYADYEHLGKYKDLNEAWVADRDRTKAEIEQIIAQAKEYYKLEEK